VVWYTFRQVANQLRTGSEPDSVIFESNSGKLKFLTYIVCEIINLPRISITVRRGVVVTALGIYQCRDRLVPGSVTVYSGRQTTPASHPG